MKESNILFFLNYRMLGVEKKFFKFKRVVLCRPTCDLPYCCNLDI